NDCLGPPGLESIHSPPPQRPPTQRTLAVQDGHCDRLRMFAAVPAAGAAEAGPERVRCGFTCRDARDTPNSFRQRAAATHSIGPPSEKSVFQGGPTQRPHGPKHEEGYEMKR